MALSSHSFLCLAFCLSVLNDMFCPNIKDLLLSHMKKTAFQSDLLTQQRKNCLNKSSQIRNFENESYQEYQFHNLEHSELDLIDTLLFLCHKNNTKAPLFERLAANTNKYATCLLTYCSQITQIGEPLCTISHRYACSQSPMLALFLAKTQPGKVHLAISQESLSIAANFLVDEAQIDKLTFIREALDAQGLFLHDMSEWNKEALTLQAGDIFVFDAFGLNPIDYSPFLLQNCQTLCSLAQTYIYHSHLQDKQIGELLSKANCHGFVPLQIWPQHPLEFIVEKQESQLLSNLIDFLHEDLNHPEKQDVIIFFPVDMHIRRYTSKLQEKLSKVHMKDHVQIITKAHQLNLVAGKNKIFLVESTHQLKSWNYDYSNALYVVDYGKEANFKFDYSNGAYVRYAGDCSEMEKAKRMSQVGITRVGRYASMKEHVKPNQHYAEDAKEISTYLLKMIDYGLSAFIDQTNSRIMECLKIMKHLQVIKTEGNGFLIEDYRVLETAKEGISPLQSQIIYKLLDNKDLSESQKRRRLNLLIMGLVICHSEGNLRQAKQQLQAAAHIKPSGIWRKSGYLQSCLQIMTKCELIEFRKRDSTSKSQSFRRKTSKFNENQWETFGNLFELDQPKKKGFEDMDIPDLIREYAVNSDLLAHLRDELDHYRQQFQVAQFNIILEPADLHKVIEHFLHCYNKSVAVYTGSRRNGFLLQGQTTGIFPDKTSLISQLNERPEYLFVVRLAENNGRRQILMCNSFPAEMYMQIFGKLPMRHSESQSEVQIDFHGLSSSIFEQLWKNNGLEITKFENEHDCLIEPNQEMAQIIIMCGKEKAEVVQAKFDAILSRIREKLSVSSKLVHYLGKTNLVLGAGGIVKEIVKADYISKCLLSNLHLQTTKEDLQDLFNEFFLLKDIVIVEPEQGKFSKSAIIHFHSQRDYYTFYNYFHECLYFDRLMDVKPLKEEESQATVRNKQYIDFKWYVWKSHRKALVQFQEAQAAVKAVAAFETNPDLDGAKVKVSAIDNRLTIQDLNELTDEIFIEDAMKAYGVIKQVEILKTPLKEIAGESSYLQSLIKGVQPPVNNFKMEPIQKRKNGLRVCRVHIPNLIEMNKVANDLNRTTGKLGQGRLYAQTWFQTPILVPHGSLTIYDQMLKECLKEGLGPNIQTYIEESEQKKTYIILKSGVKDTLDVLQQKLNLKLAGCPIFLSDYEKSIILTDIGLANLLDLQQKYHAKFIANPQNHTLNVIVEDRYIKDIKGQIKAKVQQHFFYRVSLHSKAFKFFKNNPDKLNQIKSKFTLQLIEVEEDSKALLLEGSAPKVQKAFDFLMHFIQSLSVPEEKMVNADVCGICCEEPHRPYRLQSCSHKFCRDCLTQSINTALGDVSMFPLRCPHCSVEIVIDDLECILQPGQWLKVQTTATNQYVGKRSDVMTFCYTPGCKQINMLKTDHFECDVCLATYCAGCKMRYHPLISCQDAKNNTDQLFKKYMKDNGIRQCPNSACKIPVIRIDGCYRITCSRCNKSMCFKCEPQKMIAYDDYNQCYSHLTEVHGGYW